MTRAPYGEPVSTWEKNDTGEVVEVFRCALPGCTAEVPQPAHGRRVYCTATHRRKAYDLRTARPHYRNRPKEQP